MGNDFHDYESTEKEKNELNTEDIENDTAPIGLDNIEGRNKVEEECKENEKGVRKKKRILMNKRTLLARKKRQLMRKRRMLGRKSYIIRRRLGLGLI